MLNLKDVTQIMGILSQNTKKVVAILEKKGYAELLRDENKRINLRIEIEERKLPVLYGGPSKLLENANKILK